MPKYIFVTGGVISGLGKGVTTASLGRLILGAGYNVTALKIDPYLNCDAGTMNPIEHGEVFVLDDGGEIDLDLGNYERFLDVDLTKEHNLTTGTVYRETISKERRGEFLGHTVQIIPHITNYIKNHIKTVGKKADILLIEMGGTVGDIESMPFLEAARELRNEAGENNCLFVHVTYVPILGSVGEQKTKPTQHSVKELRALGIAPDIIVARCAEMLKKETKDKISLFCDVPSGSVISAPDVDNIYSLPLLFEKQKLLETIMSHFALEKKREDLREWRELCSRIDGRKEKRTLAIVGKYITLADSYRSILESLVHAGAQYGCKVEVRWVEAEDLESGRESEVLQGVDGILVPGGFGSRGSEGKIAAIRYAREKDIPFLGICFGFQLTAVELARDVLGLRDANSTEIDPQTRNPVITLLPEQMDVKDLGGTMRLGGYDIKIKEKTLANRLYGSTETRERHRHRYEFNPEYRTRLEGAGAVFSGYCKERAEILELPGKRYFIASQFHPEFRSRPNRPVPLFLGLVRAMMEMGTSEEE
jgi:CTP synthase